MVAAEAEEEPEEYTLTTPLTAFRNVEAEDEWELAVEPLGTVVWVDAADNDNPL